MMRRLGRREASGNTQGRELSDIPLFPGEILYALQYRKAQLSRRNIEQLLKSGFPFVAFYLIMKSAEDNDNIQKALLEHVAERKFDIASLKDDDPAVSSALDNMGDRTVPSSKLAAVSRHGMEAGWISKFRTALDSRVQPGSQIFMLGHSPYIGLGVLAEYSLARGEPLGILKPDRFDRPDLPVGFMIQPSPGGAVTEFLPNDFIRPPNPLIFDDVVKTGATAQKAIGYWLGEQVENVPDFASSIPLL